MAKTVSQFSTLEEWRSRYNELASDVGEISGLRTTDKTTVVDAINDLRDREFFFQEFVFEATAAQTQFQGDDLFGNSLEFRDHRYLVFQNGNLLQDHDSGNEDFTIAAVNSNGNYTRINLASGATAGDLIRVIAFTGSFLNVEATATAQTFWNETAADVIYNNNDEGVILNGDIANQVTELESGYKIQLEGNTFINGDVNVDTGHTVTAPTITDSTLTINQGNVTGGVTGDFSGDFNVGNLDVGGGFGSTGVSITATGDINANGNADIDGTLNVDSATTLNDALTTTGLSSLDGGIAVSDGLTGDSFTVAATTGNTVIDGTLDVDGAVDIDNTINIQNGATLQSTLSVDGNVTLNDSADFTMKDSSTPTPVEKFTVDGATGNTAIKGTLAVDGNVTLGNAISDTVQIDGNLTVDGDTTIKGNLTLGDAATDNVSFGADVDSDIIPNTDDTYNLGSSDQQWKDLYVNGVANIDSLVADTADIDGGTIDGTVIGGNSAAAITGTTITANNFVIGNADIGETELEILDGATINTAELNILDGDTLATNTTLADADRVVVNDNGTMVQVALTDFETYFESALDTLSNVTTVGTLDSGSITSNFGSIDVGSSSIDGGTITADSGFSGNLTGDVTGNADTATALETARNINGVSFDGTTDITLDLDDIAEASVTPTNLFYTDERVDDRVSNLLVAGTGMSITYDDAAGTLTIDGQQGDITGVSAGTGLSGGGTSGDVELSLNASIGDLSDVDITGVTAGQALTWDGNNNRFAPTTLGTTTDSFTEGSNNLYFTNERARDAASSLITGSTHTGLSVSYTDDGVNVGSLDFALSNEYVQDLTADQIVTKGDHSGISFTYDDSTDGGINATVSISGFDTDDLTEGATNLYFTNARVDARIAAADTGDLSEGINKYFTDERAQDAAAAMITSATHSNITVTYDDNANTLSFSAAAQYGDSDARGALSAGPGIDYNSTTGKISADLNASGGLEFHTSGDGGEIRLKSSVAGDGLAHSSGVLSVNASDGIKIDSDSVKMDKTITTSVPTGVGSTAVGHLWFVV